MKLMNSSLLTAFSGVIAMPFSHLVKALPGNITHIAVNKAEGHYLAFKRDGTISYSSPMISNIVLLASAPNFRLTKPNPTMATVSSVVVLRTNSAAVDSPAQVCITDNAKSRLQCNKTSIPTLRTLSAAYASTIGVSSTLSVDIGIPEIADVTVEFFDVSYSDVSTVTLTINAPDGKTCTATTSTQTCNIETTGCYLASGWMWFYYNSRVQGHYDWAVGVEAIFTNRDDRSIFAEFKGSMVANTHTSYASSRV
ncbi:hypothetical protein EV421DRAFT_1909514 [Armillaria borealis]|uniref:Uncharacterized protein n=1 Tax=Armillaria borealis TaxID=47425 RepID=A0AA39J2Q1_9AGAR|nr:hypothetical protein EV421DRAFT_1909514 [Armillaria borealis]